MTGLQERAHELVENISTICPKSFPGFFWEEFIITIKHGEVIAWSFNCLTCDQNECPLLSANLGGRNGAKKSRQYYS